MLRIQVGCLALLVTSIANAGWALVGTSATASLYIDKDSLRVSGAMARVRSLVDLKSSANSSKGVAYSSYRDIVEFDCARGEYRYIERILYSAPMGAGNLIETISPRTDEPRIPASKSKMSQDILNFACAAQGRAVSEAKAPTVEDRCASWGLKHGTAEYVDCQIRLLQGNKGNSPEPARTPPSQPTTVEPPVRTAEQKQRDANECQALAAVQPNPFTARVKEYRQQLYGSPSSYSYSGSTASGGSFSGTVTEDRKSGRVWGMTAGAELGDLEFQEENFARQAAMRCMQSKGYKLKE